MNAPLTLVTSAGATPSLAGLEQSDMDDSTPSPALEIDSDSDTPTDAALADAIRVLIHMRNCATPLIVEDNRVYTGDTDFLDYEEDPLIIRRWVDDSGPALLWLLRNFPELQDRRFRLKFHSQGERADDVAEWLVDDAFFDSLVLVQRWLETDLLGAMEFMGQRVKGYLKSIVRNRKSIPYERYLQTQHWQEKRLRALEWAGSQCELCGSQQRLEVHHKTYERIGEEWQRDLIVLCHDCHSKFHGKLP